MANIIKFKPKAKETEEAYRALVEMLSSTEPKEVEGLIFYVQIKGSQEMFSIYNPNWELLGKTREFINEVSQEIYAENLYGAALVDIPPKEE